jgi:hypothetical protein
VCVCVCLCKFVIRGIKVFCKSWCFLHFYWNIPNKIRHPEKHLFAIRIADEEKLRWSVFFNSQRAYFVSHTITDTTFLCSWKRTATNIGYKWHNTRTETAHVLRVDGTEVFGPYPPQHRLFLVFLQDVYFKENTSVYSLYKEMSRNCSHNKFK